MDSHFRIRSSNVLSLSGSRHLSTVVSQVILGLCLQESSGRGKIVYRQRDCFEGGSKIIRTDGVVLPPPPPDSVGQRNSGRLALRDFSSRDADRWHSFPGLCLCVKRAITSLSLSRCPELTTFFGYHPGPPSSPWGLQLRPAGKNRSLPDPLKVRWIARGAL